VGANSAKQLTLPALSAVFELVWTVHGLYLLAGVASAWFTVTRINDMIITEAQFIPVVITYTHFS